MPAACMEGGVFLMASGGGVSLHTGGGVFHLSGALGDAGQHLSSGG